MSSKFGKSTCSYEELAWRFERIRNHKNLLQWIMVSYPSYPACLFKELFKCYFAIIVIMTKFHVKVVFWIFSTEASLCHRVSVWASFASMMFLFNQIVPCTNAWSVWEVLFGWIPWIAFNFVWLIVLFKENLILSGTLYSMTSCQT